MLKNRFSRGLLFWGILFLGIGGVLPTNNRFTLNFGGHRRLITRESDPLNYWGTEAGILLVGLSLIVGGIYFARKSATDPEANGAFARKTTAIIVALIGATGLAEIICNTFWGKNFNWPLRIYDGVLGIFLIGLAPEIWRKSFWAWRLGFAIAVGALGFLIGVCLHLPAVSIGEKLAIVISCLVVAIWIAIYWSRAWYRRRNWFAPGASRGKDG